MARKKPRSMTHHRRDLYTRESKPINRKQLSGNGQKSRRSTSSPGGTLASGRQRQRRSLPTDTSKTASDTREIRKLKQRWASLRPKEKGVCLKDLLSRFSSKRALARAIGRNESRVRQLVKVVDDANKANEKVEGSEPNAGPALLLSPSTEQVQSFPDAPHSCERNPSEVPSQQQSTLEGSSVHTSPLPAETGSE
jgi:hypothetical protein